MSMSKRPTPMMRMLFSPFLILAAILAAPPSVASAQLKVEEVCTPLVGCTLVANKPPIRRGKTETVHLKGPFVEHTIKSGVTTGNAAVTVSSVTKTTCVNTPCLAVALATRADHNLGIRLVPIFVSNVFGSTAFNVTIVRKGEITAMTQTPAEPAWGDTVNVRIEGNDIGNTRAAVTSSVVRNHVEAPAGNGLGVTTFMVVGNEVSNPPRSTDVTLGDDDIAGKYGNYTFSISKRTVNYRAQTSSSACATTVNIGAPTPTSPPNSQIISPTVNAVNHTLTLAWGSAQGAFKSDEQFVVEITPLNPATYTTLPGIRSKVLTVPRNTAYRWRVKAYNCGFAAPFSAYSTFSVR